uniref:ethanolamine-phosphate phospho-lyase-like n=1 Tax=Styela clava TaxID=7725 RepID=UPI00193A269C|nr:ethanolamine-phosphate phospho-lyase-like [Styela clava]
MDLNGNAVYELNKKDVLALRIKHVGSPTALYFRHDPLMIVKGEGQYLIDEKGNRYLDCINNVAHVGHSHPKVTEACNEQMSKLCTNSRYLHNTHVSLAERLANTFPNPLDVCFFTNSGSEANDLALTLAAAYSGGTDVITMDSAYHGHVRSCLEISPYKWRKPEDQKDYVHVVSAPDVYRGKYAGSENPGLDYANELNQKIEIMKDKNRKLSAFIMESLQSCGGQIIPPEGYMREAFRYVRAAGGLCIADEVQVGFGRVGSHYWAFQLQGPDVIPDIVTVGKPMGNGHPVSAVITTKEIADSLTNKLPSYFNTFGGNPVSCTIANTVMDIIENGNLMENASSVGKYLLEKFELLKKKHKIIGDVRGVGLFIGVELVRNEKTKEPATEEAEIMYNRMRDRYILVSLDGPFNNVMKFKPPMCFTYDNADQLAEVLDDTLSQISC